MGSGRPCLAAPIAAQSSFGQNGLPAFYANYITQLKPGERPEPQGRSEWLSLTRSGYILRRPWSARRSISSRSARALSTLRRNYRANIFALCGRGSLAVRAVVPSSAFENYGNTYFAVPVEFSLGSRVKLDALGLKVPGAEFDLAAVGKAGTMDHSSLGGLGVRRRLEVSIMMKSIYQLSLISLVSLAFGASALAAPSHRPAPRQ